MTHLETLNERDESLFYCDIELDDITKKFIEPLRAISLNNTKQVYILQKALGTAKEYSYDLDDIAIVLMPEHPVLIINYGKADADQIEDFLLDFKEDLGFLSDKYNYKSILGRPRRWKECLFDSCNADDFDADKYFSQKVDTSDVRKIDLLISLLIGSINDIEKIGLDDPQTLLDKVKQKIILFDGQQSRFIYQAREQQQITIQGMAGTGKTELLLHKLKDVYSTEKDSIMAFTCFNKVLANDMKSRIPAFFNFLKVEEQIEWNKRLFVLSSWGSASDPMSGLYRYVCSKYSLPFSNYHTNPNFNNLCLSALEKLNAKEDFSPCFDYIFIDESQDFKEGFFELCKKITRKTVYIAGDIFQNIYDRATSTTIKPDFLLNKCYRTDPKTLMFAHAVGMGLYEKPHINWLDDDAWRSCGYTLERKPSEGTITLSRKPLRRFEDLDATNTIRIFTSNDDSYCDEILRAIDSIRGENPNVAPEDIAVIILGSYQTLCYIADKTAVLLDDTYGWESSRGYISKYKEPGKVYISNENNVKGLEFPFVICVVPHKIGSNILQRNSIYMSLTRSFLTSYFIVDEVNTDFYETYKSAIELISETGEMELSEPSEEERQEMETRIQITLSSKKKLFPQIMEELFNEEYPKIDRETRKFVEETIGKITKGKKLSENEIKATARSFIDTYIGEITI